MIFHGKWRLLWDELALKAPQERSDEEIDQLCLGIIASGIGFVPAQRTPFRVTSAGGFNYFQRVSKHLYLSLRFRYRKKLLKVVEAKPAESANSE
ncbi:hypothetical protein ACQKNC_01670 [Lysinibacillus sp. NPDC094177]|uniref:hypothetical protein n=1 Tax=Lysinibacillus sp. NPDC094177 TaxID=3390580 RepID=UPI003D06D3CF